MKIPPDLQYTKEHEWIEVDGSNGTIGITDHAQSELGDVVFIELPEKGSEFQTGESFGSVESVKAVSEIYMPVDGEILKTNSKLEDSPESINSDPYGDGWIVRIKLKDPSQADELMNASEYEEYLKEEAGD